jgi:UDP-glucose 4-epimerase
MNTMNILVTGGCGFIGSHIVDAYIREGHRVTVLDNLSTGDIKNLNSGAKFYEDDVRNKDIERIFKAETFDVINHHAAQINVRTSVDNPLLDADINIMGSLNIIDLAIRYNVKRIIFASSGGAVYGETDQLPISEDFPTRPASPYGITKATIEQYIVTFSRLHSLDYVIFRYSNVYGPRQISKSEAGVISIFIHNILRKQQCIVFGDGSQTRDYVFVDDVVRANTFALQCPSCTLNIGTGHETSVNELIRIFSGILKEAVDHRHDDPRSGDVARNAVNPAMAKAHMQWAPRTVLKEGISRTFDYFSQQDESTYKVP